MKLILLEKTHHWIVKTKTGQTFLAAEKDLENMLNKECPLDLSKGPSGGWVTRPLSCPSCLEHWVDIRPIDQLDTRCPSCNIQVLVGDQKWPLN